MACYKNVEQIVLCILAAVAAQVMTRSHQSSVIDSYLSFSTALYARSTKVLTRALTFTNVIGSPRLESGHWLVSGLLVLRAFAG